MSHEYGVVQLPDGEELVPVHDNDSLTRSSRFDPREASLDMRRQALDAQSQDEIPLAPAVPPVE